MGGWKVVKKWKSWKWKKFKVEKMSKTHSCLTRKKYQNVFEKNRQNIWRENFDENKNPENAPNF